MFKTITSKLPPKPSPDFIDYGCGYRGRKLAIGGYVLEKDGSNEAFDLRDFDYNYRWIPESIFYRHCIVKNVKQLDKVAYKIMALHGYVNNLNNK